MLEELTACTGTSPEEYLFQESEVWSGADSGKDCFHLAVDLECKSFVSTKFYRMALDSYYRRPTEIVDTSLGYFEVDKQVNVFSELKGIVMESLRLAEGSARTGHLGFREYLSIPYVKAVTHLVSRICFLVLYSNTVFCGLFVTSSMNWSKLLLFVYGISYGYTEVKQYRKAGTFLHYLDFWNLVDMVHISVLLVAIVAGVFLSDADKNEAKELEHVLEVVASLNLILAFAKLLHVFLLSKYFGILVLVIGRMMTDVAGFSMLLLIFCLMFGYALTPIIFRKMDERMENGVAWTFYTVFGEIDGDVKKKMMELHWTIRGITQIFHYVLHLLTNVLLVNLLVAVMAAHMRTCKRWPKPSGLFVRPRRLSSTSKKRSCRLLSISLNVLLNGCCQTDMISGKIAKRDHRRARDLLELAVDLGLACSINPTPQTASC
jgi:hypothetical protein